MSYGISAFALIKNRNVISLQPFADRGLDAAAVPM